MFSLSVLSLRVWACCACPFGEMKKEVQCVTYNLTYVIRKTLRFKTSNGEIPSMLGIR